MFLLISCKKFTRVREESDEDDENQSYDLDEVASQLIRDESIDDKMALSDKNENLEEKNDEETTSNYGEDNVSAETSPKNLEKVKTEEQKMKFTKVRNISEKNKLHKKRCQLPRREDECTRRKNQK